jgi:ribosomal protein L11 methyltransferase
LLATEFPTNGAIAMAWLQLETKLGLQHPELLEAALEELGAVAVWLQDAGDEPLLEPAPGETPLWSNTLVAALFPAETDREVLTESLAGLLPDNALHFSLIVDRDWHGEWQQSLQPTGYGKRLWVVPAGSTAPPGGIVVHFSPGMAFGTGEHPTTRMCLEWLDSLTLTGNRVLDYGCGSGLLAIAALQLGAQHACAVDIDPQALEATRNNAAANACLNRLDIGYPEEISGVQQYDVLAANILSGILVKLGPAIRELLQPGARLALSGILINQAPEVCAAWKDWADLRVSAQIDDWVLLTGQKHGS